MTTGISGTCIHCGCQTFCDRTGWIDNSGGDVCGVNGDNHPHVDILDEEDG